MDRKFRIISDATGKILAELEVSDSPSGEYAAAVARNAVKEAMQDDSVYLWEYPLPEPEEVA